MSIGPEGSRNAGSDQTRSVSKACRHPEDSEARTGGILPQGADLKLSLRWIVERASSTWAGSDQLKKLGAGSNGDRLTRLDRRGAGRPFDRYSS